MIALAMTIQDFQEFEDEKKSQSQVSRVGGFKLSKEFCKDSHSMFVSKSHNEDIQQEVKFLKKISTCLTTFLGNCKGNQFTEKEEDCEPIPS